MRSILITGGAGYLGSVLADVFLREGHKVTIFDSLFFGKGHLRHVISRPNCRLVTGDIREGQSLLKALKGIDTVIHLAGITDESTCKLSPELSVEVNYYSTVRLASLSREMGIKRFIFASSCSVYGNSKEDICHEDAAVKPLSIYARSKADAEEALMAMKSNSFAPICLRLATLFGLSYRMRFDLAVNLMLKSALKEGRIFIAGGRQWRPFLHVRDAAHFFSFCLKPPDDMKSAGIFNVGSNNLNYQILDIAKLIKKYLPRAELTYISQDKKQQSYRVCFDKIEESLRYRAGLSVEDGIREIVSAIETGAFGDLENTGYYNIREFKKIFRNSFSKKGKHGLTAKAK